MKLLSMMFLLARIKIRIHGGPSIENWQDALVCIAILSCLIIGVKLLVALARAMIKRRCLEIFLLSVSLWSVVMFLLLVMHRPSAHLAETRKSVRCNPLEETRKSVRCNPNDKLVKAAERNDVKTVKNLLSSGVSPQIAWVLLLAPRFRGDSPLVLYDINVDIVRLFLDSGASLDVAMSDYDVLWRLCAGPCNTGNCEDVARLFLERGWETLKGRCDSPIGGLRSVDAINKHHVAIVRLLLDRGDDPTRAHGILKALSERQRTSPDCGVEVIELLLKRGNWSADDLSDALDSALKGCRFESCRQAANLLLENGAPVPKDATKAIQVLNECLGKARDGDAIVTGKLIRHLGGRIEPEKGVTAPIRRESKARKDVRLRQPFNLPQV